MRKRFKALLAVGLAALLALGLVAPSAAGARPVAKVRITGGSSTLTTAPGLVGKLLGEEIVSFVTAPGSQTLRPSKTGGTLIATYPVSGGTVTKSQGVVRHRGGLVIFNVSNNRSAAVDSFQLDLAHKVLTARLVPTKNRATVFTVNVRHIKVQNPTKHLTTISGLGLFLDKNAALLLDNVLKTTAFKPGMKFGTAVSRLRH